MEERKFDANTDVSPIRNDVLQLFLLKGREFNSFIQGRSLQVEIVFLGL